MNSTPAVVVLAGLAVALWPAALQTSGAKQASGTPESTLAGMWNTPLHEADGVELDFRMPFTVAGTGQQLRWEAYSRQGAAREMAVLGQLASRRCVPQTAPNRATLIHPEPAACRAIVVRCDRPSSISEATLEATRARWRRSAGATAGPRIASRAPHV